MPLGNLNLEFLNHNAQRRYPFADDADLVDTTGEFKLPDDFVVELDLAINSGMNVGPAGFFLQSVSAFAGGYGIVIGYQPADESSPITIATALIPRQGFTRNSVFALGGVGMYSDAVGKVVIGRFDNVDKQPPGFWQFILANARLDPDAIRPMIQGVTSITCVNGSQTSVPLTGDIELVAGSNILLVPVIQDGQDPIITINAISGEGTVDACVCTGDAAQTAPITSINGVSPTASGALAIIGSTCVQVSTIQNGLSIADTCSSPCCGCTELETITQDLMRLGSQADTVNNFATNLQSAVESMSMVVLGSKLNDRGCVVG